MEENRSVITYLTTWRWTELRRSALTVVLIRFGKQKLAKFDII